jgi:hypothetical protein
MGDDFDDDELLFDSDEEKKKSSKNADKKSNNSKKSSLPIYLQLKEQIIQEDRLSRISYGENNIMQ